MAAPIIQAQYDVLDQIGGRFAAQAEGIQTLQGVLRRAFAPLAAGNWRGHAADGFVHEMDGVVLPATVRLAEALSAAQAVTLQIQGILREAEAEAAALFAGIPPLASGGAAHGSEKPLEPRRAQRSKRVMAFQPGDLLPEPTYVIPNVTQAQFSSFVSQYEDNGDQEPDNLEKYLTNPELMALQRKLITDLALLVQSGGAPLSPAGLYEMALDATGDPGTALMVAHNITKALSRGFSPIGWTLETRDPLVYSMDGQTFAFDTATFHPNALATNSVGKPSVFYALFDAQALGTDDAGDWYHFYLEAAAAYYGASGELNFNADPGPYLYSRIIEGTLDSAMEQMVGSTPTDAQRGWAYANALSYLEGAKYGGDYAGAQDEITRESQLHREGALFGLELAGVQPADDWNWYIPELGAATGKFDTDVNIADDTYRVVAPDGSPH